ncbi:hypothetical protein SAMN06265339_1073 [Desulfurobacterium pacificum]|jgi:hypothetical protein|uniref:Lipoprotein n=1 Tax=Desulfurobacterium pacificum TaxID=240166 RepID=A0ABY1NLJ6_9BACT|nr:hypothetical protein [Desulfurobacterium pacificum]SMP12782.1 hypothetical protein SAMN06265339_1073 [Desulfurobacterium pacificum]
MRKILLTLPFIALVAVSSCATLNTSGQTEVKVQTIKPEMLLGDSVPVYPGFRFVPQKSFIYESGDIKVGRLVFTGDAKVKDIVSYYKDVLPQQGWEPVAITIYGNQASLTYVTPDKTLQIQVSKGFSETVLVIQIGPRGELTTKSE